MDDDGSGALGEGGCGGGGVLSHLVAATTPAMAVGEGG